MPSLEEMRELAKAEYGLETIRAWKQTLNLLLDFVEKFDNLHEAGLMEMNWERVEDFDLIAAVKKARKAIQEEVKL